MLSLYPAFPEDFTTDTPLRVTIDALEVPLWLSGRGQQLARQIMDMLDDGQSEAKIARTLRCHIRTVRRYRSRVPSAQMDMFAVLEAEQKPCAGTDFDES